MYKRQIQIHAQLLADSFVGPAGAGEIHDNRAHGADAMGPAGAVMSDGGGNTLVEGLVQGGDGKVAVDALLDVCLLYTSRCV